MVDRLFTNVHTNDYLQCKFYTLLCCFEIFFKDINGVFFLQVLHLRGCWEEVQGRLCFFPTFLFSYWSFRAGCSKSSLDGFPPQPPASKDKILKISNVGLFDWHSIQDVIWLDHGISPVVVVAVGFQLQENLGLPTFSRSLCPCHWAKDLIVSH